MSLIGWLLLFLSKCLDQAFPSPTVDEEKQQGKEKENSSSTTNPSNRWDFIQGDAGLNNNKSSVKASSARLYRRKLQKRLMHHKQHLLDLQTAKKNFMTNQLEKSSSAGLNKEAELLLKQHEIAFKLQLKQYSSKVKYYKKKVKDVHGKLVCFIYILLLLYISRLDVYFHHIWFMFKFCRFHLMSQLLDMVQSSIEYFTYVIFNRRLFIDIQHFVDAENL